MQRIAEHQRRAEGKARERPEFEETAVKAAPVVGRIFGHEGRRAAIFTAGREALEHPEQDQPRRRPEADALIRRDQPDRSEEHTSELQSLMRISYAVICLNKQNIIT